MSQKLLHKLFIGGDWNVAYRKIDDQKNVYAPIATPKDMWIADPFLFELDGEHYLFVEVYLKKENIGAIGYYKFINGQPIFQDIIIKNKYHMSYPCVFSYKGTQYMIPETSGNSTIELYKATHFPDQWEKDTILLCGEKYVDNTVFSADGHYYLISYTKLEMGHALVLFSLDMEGKAIRKISQKTYERNVGRPAGSIFGMPLVRPAQNCVRKYGEGLYFYYVTQLNEMGFDEEEKEYLPVTDIPVSGKFQRVHTYNRDSMYEVVDLFREKVDFLHAFKIFFRKKKKNSI